MTRKLCMLLLLCVTLFALTACGGSGLSAAEMKDTFRALTEASYEINDIYYGEGLPFVRNESVMAYLTGTAQGTDGFKVSYMPVADGAAYTTEADIRKATKAVYSPAMCEILFGLGFTGFSTADDERVAFARYIEQDGVLTVRVDLAEDAIAMGRTYDFDSMEVLIDEENRVRAEFQSYMNGEPSDVVRITIVNTADGWRLDSPTY